MTDVAELADSGDAHLDSLHALSRQGLMEVVVHPDGTATASILETNLDPHAAALADLVGRRVVWG